MVKSFFLFHLGLVAILCAILAACFARPMSQQSHYHLEEQPPQPPKPGHRYDVVLEEGTTHVHRGGTIEEEGKNGDHLFQADDGTARSERSTNLSHITGTARKIQMYVKNRNLQILPDGTVNGTSDDAARREGCIDYTILQRSSVNNGQLKIQSVATCLFLCMDSCGLLYGSREFTEDCIFNEMIEQHHYNTYSSAKYSNEKRTLYLALNKRGQPRKVQIRKNLPLGKLSTYTKVLTQTVPTEKVDHLVAKILAAREAQHQHLTASQTGVASAHHPLRHHGYNQLCPQVPTTHSQAPEDNEGRDKFRCRRRKKRKKKKRRCREGEEEGEQCQKTGVGKNRKNKKKCDGAEDEEECLQRLQATKKKRKLKNAGAKKSKTTVGGKKKLKKQRQLSGTSDSDFQNSRLVERGETSLDLGAASAIERVLVDADAVPTEVNQRGTPSTTSETTMLPSSTADDTERLEVAAEGHWEEDVASTLEKSSTTEFSGPPPMSSVDSSTSAASSIRPK